MKTIKTDLSYLNKLVRGLLADSAVGFFVLAVIVALMSVFLHYDDVSVFMRQLDKHAFREIEKQLRPIPFVTANQASQELEQRGIRIASAEPVILQSSLANPSEDNRNDNRVATRPASAKNIRVAQEKTQGVDRVAKTDLVIAKASPSVAGYKNPENKSLPKADDDYPVDKVKLDSSRHRD